MTEESEPKPTPFDAEWEIRKLSGRIMDIMDIIDDLKSKDKSLSARISRNKLSSIEWSPEDDEGEPEGKKKEIDLESLSLEQRALLLSELMDRANLARE